MEDLRRRTRNRIRIMMFKKQHSLFTSYASKKAGCFMLLWVLAFSSVFAENMSHPEKLDIPNPPETINFHLFPLNTKALSPGIVEGREINLPMATKPIFIIGSDPLSINWLKKNLDQLKKIAALGMLVESRSKSDFERIQSIANGLEILPISGEIFNEQLHITHYPVLISQHLIEQEGVVDDKK